MPPPVYPPIPPSPPTHSTQTHRVAAKAARGGVPVGHHQAHLRQLPRWACICAVRAGQCPQPNHGGEVRVVSDHCGEQHDVELEATSRRTLQQSPPPHAAHGTRAVACCGEACSVEAWRRATWWRVARRRAEGAKSMAGGVLPRAGVVRGSTGVLCGWVRGWLGVVVRCLMLVLSNAHTVGLCHCAPTSFIVWVVSERPR